MRELYQIQLTAYLCMGQWQGAITIYEPRDNGSFQSTQVAHILCDPSSTADPVEDILAVLEHTHCAVLDATEPST